MKNHEVRADYMPMDDPAGSAPESDDVPNDADLKFVNDYMALVQQEIKLCNAILIEGSSDDVAEWAVEELMDSSEDYLELKAILADLEEDKADGGADEGNESSAMMASRTAKVAAARKRARRAMMTNSPPAY